MMVVSKWLAGTVVAVLMVCAVLLWRQSAPHAAALHFSAPASAQVAGAVGTASAVPLIAPVSDVTPADREAKRFSLYEKDKDGAITRDEYLANGKKAFAKLDLDHDGKLSFAEYSVKAIAKFDAADTKHDGRLTPDEFATTAVKRKPRTKAVCPPGGAVAAAPEEPGEAQ